MGASIVTTHEGAWRRSDRDACLAENDAPQLIAEREQIIPRDPMLRVDGAVGGAMGLGSPAGVGAYLGHTREGTPGSIGCSGFVRADVTAVRPVWLSAQAQLFATPNLRAASYVTDVFVGWDFFGYGNTFHERRAKRTQTPYYDCSFGRWDVALALGLKEVMVRDDPRMQPWHAGMAGVQMRFLRYLLGGTIGIDFDILGVYEPATHGAGMQLHDVLHVGAFVFTQNIGFVWNRGAWGTIGVGTHVDL